MPLYTKKEESKLLETRIATAPLFFLPLVDLIRDLIDVLFKKNQVSKE